MKKFTKVLAFALAMVLTLAMTSMVFADTTTNGNYSITIKNDAEGHTYEAYQILAGDLSQDGTTLSNVKWGNGVDQTKVKTLINSGSADDFAKALGEITSKSAQADAAAAKIGKILNASNVYKSGDYNKGTYTISGLPSGYYLVKDMDGSLDQKDGDAYTLYIMEVVGNVTVNAKSDTVTVEKKIKDVNDTTGETSDWQDSADYDIGDSIPFQLTGTLPSNYANFDTYYYAFHDTESNGLTFNNDAVVYAVEGKTETVIDASSYTVTTRNDGFDIVFADLKKITSVNKNTKIVVRYTSTLNENAVIGALGNPNEVYLEYSNNPNNDGHGKTNKDVVIAFTYKVVVNKVDQDNEPLAGAEFTLKKILADGTEKVIDVITTEEGTVFTFNGLDDGQYVLSETVTPDGFNTIDDITFTVTADHEILSDDPQLTDLAAVADGGVVEFTVTKTDGMIDGGLVTDIVNQKGSILPSTGGAGRVAIYLIGAILVLGVGVVAVSKLRARQ